MARAVSRPAASRQLVAFRATPRSTFAQPKRALSVRPLKAVDLDWTDPDTIIGAAACVLGVVVGVGTVAWYGRVVERDDERLESIRQLNKATYEATGEYLPKEEVEKMRGTKWTDRREFKDDD